MAIVTPWIASLRGPQRSKMGGGIRTQKEVLRKRERDMKLSKVGGIESGVGGTES